MGSRVSTGAGNSTEEAACNNQPLGNLPRWAVLSEEQRHSLADKTTDRVLHGQRHAHRQCTGDKAADKTVQSQTHGVQTEKATRACTTPPQQSRDARIRMSSATASDMAPIESVSESRGLSLPQPLIVHQCN